MEKLHYTAAEAESFIDEGRPTAADLIAREALARDPFDAAAWAALARVAAAIGEADTAARFARIAGQLSPPEAPSPSAAGERFMLIKAWGCGFCSDLDHVLGCLLLCEITGRTPVTHWGANSLFSVDAHGDAFREYFEPLSALTVDDLLGKGLDFWPPKWRETNLREERLQKQWGEYSRVATLEMLNRPERVVVSDYHTGVVVLAPWIRPGHPLHGKSIDEIYRYLIARYLRPVVGIRELVDQFAGEHFSGGPIIAAHIRGGDKFIEDPELPQKLAKYGQAIDFVARGNAQARIFLLTDTVPVVDEYRARYGARLIATESVRTSSNEGVHFMAHPDRRRLGVEVLRDICLAIRCDGFVGIGSSTVSCMIHYMKPGGWPPGSSALLGRMGTLNTDPGPFMSFEQLERYLEPAQAVELRKYLARV